MTKICSKCDEEKPIENFSKHKSSKGGRRANCKVCQNKYYVERSKKIKTRGPTKIVSEKKCSDCTETKSVEEFYLNKNTADGFDRRCKECSKKRYHNMIDNGYEWPRHSEKTPEGKEKCRERAQRRRCIVKYNTHDQMPKGWRQKLLEFYENKCLICGTSEKLEADHVIPLSDGGSHSAENLQVLCQFHNRSKGGNFADYRDGKVFHL